MSLPMDGHATPRNRDPLVLLGGVALGMAIAWVDSRPGWDDSGVSAMALLISGAVLGFLAPRRPWRWALAIGLWIPVYLVVRTPTLATAGSGLAILLFPLAGAYGGMLLRRLMTAA